MRFRWKTCANCRQEGLRTGCLCVACVRAAVIPVAIVALAHYLLNLLPHL